MFLFNMGDSASASWSALSPEKVRLQRGQRRVRSVMSASLAPAARFGENSPTLRDRDTRHKLARALGHTSGYAAIPAIVPNGGRSTRVPVGHAVGSMNGDVPFGGAGVGWPHDVTMMRRRWPWFFVVVFGAFFSRALRHGPQKTSLGDGAPARLAPLAGVALGVSWQLVDRRDLADRLTVMAVFLSSRNTSHRNRRRVLSHAWAVRRARCSGGAGTHRTSPAPLPSETRSRRPITDSLKYQ